MLATHGLQAVHSSALLQLQNERGMSSHEKRNGFWVADSLSKVLVKSPRSPVHSCKPPMMLKLQAGMH